MNKIELAKQWCLERIGNPYVYGGTGKTCTVSYREARAAQYPSYAAKISKNCQRMSGGKSTCEGCKWADEDGVGKLCYDCAQFVRWCMDYIGIYMVSGANSQWLQTDWAEQGTIDTLPKDKLCIVYREDADGKKHHTGVYLGDGTIAHAKGHDYGVVRDKLGEPRFTHWGIPKRLYEEVTPVKPKWPKVVKGDSGDYVIAMQILLVLHGLSIGTGGLLKTGVDGKFGAKTMTALKEFQAMNGINITGICNTETWNALLTKDVTENTTATTEKEKNEAQPIAENSDTITLDRETAKTFYNVLGAAL